MTQQAKQSTQLIQQQVPNFKPRLGIILGSGLGEFAEQLNLIKAINYADLPGFPVSRVAGHHNQLYLAHYADVPVVCCRGRAHFYEGIEREQTLTMIRTLQLLGCDFVLITNAAGSLKPEWPPGSLVLLKDHINLQFNNILAGPNDDEFGPRFVDMSNAYDRDLRQQLLAIAKQEKIDLPEGVYLGCLGPTFETPAEIKAFSTLGADVVGMSTVPEVIAARHCGLRVAAISAVTNLAAGMSDEKLSQDHTIRGAKLAKDKLIKLVSIFIASQQHIIAE
jgi:xanthosine phosphorylase